MVSLAVVLVVVIFFGAIRYRLRGMPLERDEGEYAYAGQLLLQGVPPYRIAYNLKLPGIYAAYAAMLAVFGDTPAGIHLGLLLINAATSILLYFLASRLFGRLAGVAAALCYSVLSTSGSVMGYEAHATNFVVLPAILSILLLLHALDSGRAWLFAASGLLSGIAFLMKQHGIFLAAFCFFYLVSTELRQSKEIRNLARDSACFAAGAILPYAATCGLLYRAGVFPKFWFWTVSYAAEYSKMGLRRAIRDFLENFAGVISPVYWVWILAVAGITAPWWSASARKHARFLFGFLTFSFLALCPGAYFRPHYFILLLPAAAILVSVAVASAAERLKALPLRFLSAIPAVVVLVAVTHAVFQQRQEYFFLTPEDVFQDIYDINPFPAAMTVGDYLKKHSPEDARIGVLGSEPEIYFYANRHSATGYLYMYSLIVHQKYTARMRAEMMTELNANRPDYLVYVDESDSWGVRTGPPDTEAFLAALHEFMDSQYEKIGVAEIDDTTTYVWGDGAKGYVPHSTDAMYVLKRRGTAGAPGASPR